MAGIILIAILSVLCFFSYWFLCTDAYFAHSREAEGKVTEVLYGDNSNNGIQYLVHFQDNDQQTRDALSPWYKKNDAVQKGDTVSIKYVSFKAGWKPVLALRIQNKNLVNDERFRVFLVAGIATAALVAISIVQFCAGI